MFRLKRNIFDMVYRKKIKKLLYSGFVRTYTDGKIKIAIPDSSFLSDEKKFTLLEEVEMKFYVNCVTLTKPTTTDWSRCLNWSWIVLNNKMYNVNASTFVYNVKKNELNIPPFSSLKHMSLSVFEREKLYSYSLNNKEILFIDFME